jgi:hypothetical protein
MDSCILKIHVLEFIAVLLMLKLFQMWPVGFLSRQLLCFSHNFSFLTFTAALPPQTYIPLFLPGALVPLCGQWYLETKTWVFIVNGMSLFLGLFSEQNQEVRKCNINVCVNLEFILIPPIHIQHHTVLCLSPYSHLPSESPGPNISIITYLL